MRREIGDECLRRRVGDELGSNGDSGVVGSDSTTGELCIGLHAAAFDSGEGGDTTLKLFGVRRMRREIGDECLRRRVGDELGGDNMTEEKVSTRRPKALVTWSSQLMSL
jgi:hypothetical protein